MLHLHFYSVQYYNVGKYWEVLYFLGLQVALDTLTTKAEAIENDLQDTDVKTWQHTRSYKN